MSDLSVASQTVLDSPNARTAIWAIDTKLTLLRTLADDRLPHHVAAAIAECCWWIAALDELMIRELPAAVGLLYKRARAANANGRHVEGVLWARNRHSHQLVVDTHQGDERPFLSTRPGVVVFISRPLRWEPVTSMALTPKELQMGKMWQPAYEDLFQGQPVTPPLAAASEWFKTLAPLYVPPSA